MGTLDPTLCEQTDEALQEWRQGDCVLGEQWFLYRVDPAAPLTEAAIEASTEAYDNAEANVPGLMVASQTCDLVRGCGTRPFVEVCPLVEVDKDELHQIERGRMPRYTFIPTLADRGLVADLDRVMTVEKPVLATWERVEGCKSDAQRRDLSRALARKRSRVAFPHQP